MLPAPEMCGRKISFALPQRRPALWILPVVIVLGVFAFVALIVVHGAWLLVSLASALAGCAKNRPPRCNRWVTLASHSISIDGVVVQLNGVRSIEVRGSKLVLRLRKKMFVSVDMSKLAEPSRRLFVRHVEARRRVSRRPPRPRAEEIALEAFYVYDAHAVLVDRRELRAILPPSGPWLPTRHARIYVRELPPASDPYRAAHPDVIVVGTLQ